MFYRVWHIPQVPMEAFRFDVPDEETGKLLLNALAKYDIFQFENRIKPDFCNAGGLEQSEDGENWDDCSGDDDFDWDEEDLENEVEEDWSEV